MQEQISDIENNWFVYEKDTIDSLQIKNECLR